MSPLALGKASKSLGRRIVHADSGLTKSSGTSGQNRRHCESFDADSQSNDGAFLRSGAAPAGTRKGDLRYRNQTRRRTGDTRTPFKKATFGTRSLAKQAFTMSSILTRKGPSLRQATIDSGSPTPLRRQPGACALHRFSDKLYDLTKVAKETNGCGSKTQSSHSPSRNSCMQEMSISRPPVAGRLLPPACYLDNSRIKPAESSGDSLT